MMLNGKLHYDNEVDFERAIKMGESITGLFEREDWEPIRLDREVSGLEKAKRILALEIKKLAQILKDKSGDREQRALAAKQQVKSIQRGYRLAAALIVNDHPALVEAISRGTIDIFEGPAASPIAAGLGQLLELDETFRKKSGGLAVLKDTPQEALAWTHEVARRLREEPS